MALPFLSSQSRRRDQIVAIDLGARTTKAVQLQKRHDEIHFLGYALQDAPAYEKGLSPQLLGEHLNAIVQALGTRTKQVVLVLGVGESLLRHAELPAIPVGDMRVMLKFNSKNYLQQDLPDYVFDCYIMPPRAGTRPEAMKAGQKCRVLVGGARRQAIDDLQSAARLAGLMPEEVVPGLIGPPNAFEMAQPEVFVKDAVALVDIGFKNSSISILLNGELMLSRVVAIGGDRLTNGVAEALGVSYAEAEGIKVGLPSEVQSTMVSLLSPLGRELRASIDFFEHQQDKTVTQVFLSGGSARSDHITQILQTELMVQCTSWNPASFLKMSLPPQQMGEVEQIAPQLAVAIGAAVAAF
ncbi:MAG TPA: pilus assembly protein PilM [Candidatus Eisenbacteria bacterium]|nr:pilus assembly protein PilM [Candidatus Eisenbacteria bacterium]